MIIRLLILKRVKRLRLISPYSYIIYYSLTLKLYIYIYIIILYAANKSKLSVGIKINSAGAISKEQNAV